VAVSAHAQFVQQGAKLVGTDAIGDAFQGLSVAVSSDGNTAIVGGPYDNFDAGTDAGAGAVWVYTRAAGAWAQQGGKLVAADAAGNSNFGYSVAISADGNTAIVGGPNDNYIAGAAWVFTRSGGVWTQQGSKLVGTGAVNPPQQGWSVALSADGNTAIVGGPNENSRVGAAWVFTRAEGVWTQQGGKLVETGTVEPPGLVVAQGTSVSLSADGNTAIVGAPVDNNNSGVGAAWVYTRSGGVWTQQGDKLVGGGISVALSADGNTALVGGPGDNTYAGAAWVYTRSEGVWTQQGSKLVGYGAAGDAGQGASVALSADGNTALVGGPDDNSGEGAAWVWARSGTVWTQGGKLVASGAAGGRQGTTVALSADGSTAIVGAPFDGAAGAVWVFVVPATPAPAPTVATHAPGPITSDTAVLEGSINPNGLDTHAWFLYGTDSALSGAVSTPQQDLGSGTAPIPINATISGLFASAPYYFQAWAQSSAATVQGSILSLTTTLVPPTVGTSAATSVTDGSATLNASANPNGADTNVWFLYSTNSSMTGAVSTPQQDIGAGSAPVEASANIVGLAVSTTYYFQAVAQDSGGITKGSILSFTTGPAQAPAVTASTASSIASGSATLGASVDPNGLETLAWFLYSANSSLAGALSTAPQDIGSGTLAVPASANIAGLSANTTYYFQTIAQNADGTAQGQILSFTTAVPAQEGSKLVGTGAVGGSQGSSVALSADGSTAIVGGPSDNGGVGAAWVYTRSGGVWTQQGAKLVGGGASVALASDGNTALVGGCGGAAGVACVYARSGGLWTQESILPAGTGAVGKAAQGSSVALSADGNTALVGGPSDNGGVGAVWVYTRSGGVWSQQGDKLVGAGAITGAGQGYSVALSSDGNTAIVGGPYDNQVCTPPECPGIQPPYCSSTGAVWVFTRSADAWAQQGGKLVPSGVAFVAAIGSAVALSGDGNTAIVGGTGAAWVFTRSGSAWFQQGGELVSSGVASVALSADGNTAAVGGPDDNTTCVLVLGMIPCTSSTICVSAGAVWLFTRSAGVWTQLGDKLVGAGGVNAAQGYSVALSADGDTLILGGPSDGSEPPGIDLSGNGITGAAWVFTVPEAQPSRLQRRP
jgi:hypothetical protein